MQQQVRRLGRRIAIAIAGGLVILAGVILGPMPVVPGFPLILVGLGILSLEFERPRIWLAAIKAKGRTAARRLFRRRSRSGDVK
jgi:hypothetical protein